jgi:F-type H+-transporting ATPase subunit delta
MALAPRIAERYAEALYAIACEQSQAEAWERQLAAVAGVFAHSPELLDALTHPEVAVEVKERLLTRTLGSNLPPEILTTLMLLIRRGHEPDTAALHAAFLRQWNRDRRVIPATVTSAVALTSEQARLLAEALAKRTGATIQLTQQVDPALVAGLVVRMGDRVIDASAQTALQDLHTAMRGG